MTAHKQGGFITVRVSSKEVNTFRDHFPCSGIPENTSFQFELDGRNGDLVDIVAWVNPDGLYEDYQGESVDSADFDHGSGLQALSLDATNLCVDNGMLPQWARRP